MRTRSKSSQFQSRIILLTALAALVTAGPALPQSTASNSSSANAVKDPEGGYSLVDLDVFFGTQWYQIYQGSGGAGNQFFLTRPITGARVEENFSRYVSLEEAYSVGFNRLAILPSGGSSYATVGSRNGLASLLGVFNFTPRDSRIRPYAVLGPGVITYWGGSLQQPATGVQAIPVPFKTATYAGLVYGVGAKVNLNRRFAVTYDLRGVWSSKTADFGLPNISPGRGSLFITHNHGESSLALTVGIAFRFGYREPPAPAAPAPPPPPPAPVASIQVGAIQGERAGVCPGDNVRLTVTASGWLPDQTPTYAWSVNNQSVPGANGPAFNLPTANVTGTQRVSVTVSAGGSTRTSDTVNISIGTLSPPTIQFSVSPTTIAYGDRLPLNATAAVSECATATPLRYTASEGTIAGNTFDSSSMSFDSNGAGLQQKVVRLTATETDSKNQTASANANVTVNYKRPSERTDIVFPNRSSRVNNAAKRFLIDVLTPKLRADPNSTVILIGHRDTSETGRAAANLDTQRVLNAAAVLSAGKGICPSLDLSRVQVKSDGTDQTDTPMPFADVSVRERSGQSANDQRSQFRRVEVWFIPGGSDKPAVSGLQAAPEREIKAKGCPR